jgi:hypothetical protein
MEAVVTIDQVMTFETRTGTMRYVVRDSDGNEYTTFRESIGEQAGRVEPAPDEPGRGEGDTDPDEAAWRTAVEAAPWLVGESEPHEEVPPDQLYEKLKPFKERVAEDIKEDD